MNDTKPRVHFTPLYLQNPVHDIRVHLVGAGGNGSQMLSALARIDHALRSLERPGLDVTVFDPDTVEEPNIGRQLFSNSELGQNKAVALVSRFNRFYGLDWKAEPNRYVPAQYFPRNGGWHKSPNIIVSCTDNVKSRLSISDSVKLDRKRRCQNNASCDLAEGSWMYWLDLGNSRYTGQAVLGSNVINQPESQKYDTVDTLPLITDIHRLSVASDRNSEPSCSMAEALKKQDLFINSVLVQNAGSLLWNLLLKGHTQIHGFYVNLEDMNTMPIYV